MPGIMTTEAISVITKAKKVRFLNALKVAFLDFVDPEVSIPKVVVCQVSGQKYPSLFTNANQIRYHSQKHR